MPANKRTIYSDLKKLDAHIIQPHEYDDAPELTDEQIAAADLYEDGKLIHRGRGRPPLPPGERKTEVKVRLDRDLVDELRASGPGWQTRMNATMRDAVFGHSKGRQAARSPAIASKSLGRPRSTAAAPSGKGKAGGAGRGHRRGRK